MDGRLGRLAWLGAGAGAIAAGTALGWDSAALATFVTPPAPIRATLVGISAALAVWLLVAALARLSCDPAESGRILGPPNGRQAGIRRLEGRVDEFSHRTEVCTGYVRAARICLRGVDGDAPVFRGIRHKFRFVTFRGRVFRRDEAGRGERIRSEYGLVGGAVLAEELHRVGLALAWSERADRVPHRVLCGRVGATDAVGIEDEARWAWDWMASWGLIEGTFDVTTQINRKVEREAHGLATAVRPG